MATTDLDIDENWVEIATGPCLIEAQEGVALLHFGQAAPAADSNAYHKLGAGWLRSFDYGGTEKVFVRSSARGGSIVYTAAA